jgi:hypothetical protein
MKAILKYSIGVLLVIATSCHKDKPTVPVLETVEPSEISYFSASGGGMILKDGGADIISQGVCWSLSSNPTTLDNKMAGNGNSESFTCKISQLNSNTVYHIKAFATNSAGTGYGEEFTFTTLQTLAPSVSTNPAASIVYRSAVVEGNITSDNGEPVLERGVCWSLSENPTISGTKLSSGSGLGIYTISLSQLQPSTKYYVRAYGINHVGITYGNQVEFTTMTPTIPTLSTSSVSSISTKSAMSGGEITNENGEVVTTRGICWSTSPSPTVNNSKTIIGSGIGTFSGTLDGLTSNTTYYIRAFAQNSVGVAYGDQKVFNTSELPLNLKDGLIAYYPFNGNASDVSGNSNNGTVNGAVLSVDKFGHPNCAYSFNGTSDYILLQPESSFKGMNSYSVSLWVNPTEIVYNGGEMVYSLGSNVYGPVHGLTYQSTETFFAGSYNVGGTSPNQSYSKSCCYNPNTWYHVVVTRNNSSINLYINGTLIAPGPEASTKGQDADYGLASAAVLGGRSSLEYRYFFKGIIDEVRIYNRVLTSEEITSLKELNQ